MSPKVILLVEDNRSDEKLAVLAFQRCGVPNELVVTRDGAEALDYLRDATELPAVVLLDLKMPRVGGLEVLERMRAEERTRLVPVVILTASREDEDLLRGYRLGANAYVRKPVDFGEFAKAATTMGVFWLLLNELPPHAGGR